MTYTYNIAGMTCGSCVAKVKAELLKLGDVASAEVQLAAPQVQITMQKHISIAKLQEAVGKAGHYTISEQDVSLHTAPTTKAVQPVSYFPIFLIFMYIAAVPSLVQLSAGRFMVMEWMSHFMGGFFLVFSFFKLMNLRGFADGYRSYDVVAKALPVYGFIYPFLELALGVSFIMGWYPLLTNILTLIVMGVSTIGVLQSLMKKSPFQCACLGTIIKLPLSKVTLLEDLLMVIMSIVMIANLI